MNASALKDLLEEFIEKNCEASQYPTELDKLLSDTARTGVVRFSWQLLKPLLKFRLESVLKSEALNKGPEDDEELAKQLPNRLDSFEHAPFTIQRVCELVVQPSQHYKYRDKYMRAMEKNLMVVSTQAADLAWMKSPRLAQLLEDATPEPITTPNHHSHTPMQLPEQNPLSTKVSESEEQTHIAMVTDSAKETESGKSDPETALLGILGLPRKRSSSFRDSLDHEESGRGETGEKQDAMGLVLQEADSTTLEHTSRPLSSPPGVRMTTPIASGQQLTPTGQTESVGMETEPLQVTETPLGSEEAVKKVCCVDASEEGVVSPIGGVVCMSNEEEGLREVETVPRKETYKEEATGQMELETQSEDRVQTEMESS